MKERQCVIYDNTIMHVPSAYSAIFVDYENVYYHLSNKYADIPELSDFVVELLMNREEHLKKKY